MAQKPYWYLYSETSVYKLSQNVDGTLGKISLSEARERRTVTEPEGRKTLDSSLHLRFDLKNVRRSRTESHIGEKRINDLCFFTSKGLCSIITTDLVFQNSVPFLKKMTVEDTKKKYRNYAFTMNNYPDKVELHEALDALECRYMKYGKEVCPTTKTPHLQGMVCFTNPISVKSARKKLAGCHVEIMISLEGSLAYTEKDGDFTERGDKPVSQADKGKCEEERWKNIREASEEGRFEDIPDSVRFKQYRAIEHFHSNARKKRKLDNVPKKNNIWYYGPPDAGKSHRARKEFPDAYLKNCNKWWCGYDDHEVVLIEDFDKKHECLIYHMKIWADIYPFHGEVKKEDTGTIRPKKIIVTSNYHPNQIWWDPADLNPILKRFVVTECFHDPNWVDDLHVSEASGSAE